MSYRGFRHIALYRIRRGKNDAFSHLYYLFVQIFYVYSYSRLVDYVEDFFRLSVVYRRERGKYRASYYRVVGVDYCGCACRSLVVEPHSQFKGLAESYVHGKVDVTSVYARRSDKNTLLFVHLYELIHVHAVVVVRNTGDGVVAVLVGDRREGMIYTASVLRGKVGRQNKVSVYHSGAVRVVIRVRLYIVRPAVFVFYGGGIELHIAHVPGEFHHFGTSYRDIEVNLNAVVLDGNAVLDRFPAEDFRRRHKTFVVGLRTRIIGALISHYVQSSHAPYFAVDPFGLSVPVGFYLPVHVAYSHHIAVKFYVDGFRQIRRACEIFRHRKILVNIVDYYRTFRYGKKSRYVYAVKVIESCGRARQNERSRHAETFFGQRAHHDGTVFALRINYGLLYRLNERAFSYRTERTFFHVPVGKNFSAVAAVDERLFHAGTVALDGVDAYYRFVGKHEAPFAVLRVSVFGIRLNLYFARRFAVHGKTISSVEYETDSHIVRAYARP